jgi:peptidoglycan/LPS O-acetylase OafA/YrhL
VSANSAISVRFYGIQILRGYLALSVVIGHSITSIIPSPLGPDWIAIRDIVLMVFHPRAAVTVFFVISGFVLAHGVSKTPQFNF